MSIPTDILEKALQELDNSTPLKKVARTHKISRAYLRFKHLEHKNTELERRLEVQEQINKLNNAKATLFLYDIHYPYENQEHINMAIDYAKSKYEINRLVIGGDCIDCASISRFAKTADTMPLHEEIAYTVGKLRGLRKQFTDSSFIFIKGNHEDRLQKYLYSKASEIASLKGLTIQEQLELGSMGMEWIDNEKLKQETGRFFSISGLSIAHGHDFQICPSVNAAYRFLERAKTSIILGHVHTADEKYTNIASGETIGAFCVGTLAHMYPSYRPANNWIAGFACVIFDEDGKHFMVDNRKIINGRIV